MTEHSGAADDAADVPDPAGGIDPIFDAATGAEDLDEDRLQADPLEEGMDPPEGWSAADRYGVTAAEQRTGESLEQRLWQEQPDPADRSESEDAAPTSGDRPDPDMEVPGRDVAQVPLPDDAEDVGPDDPPGGQVTDTMAEHGRSADQAGGSMAQAERSDGFDPAGPAAAGAAGGAG